MKILVSGANGFIASALVHRLLELNHEVVACCRSKRNLPVHPKLTHVMVDFRSSPSEVQWSAMLRNVEIVVNCAGILTENHDNEFEQVHIKTPSSLLAAAEIAGVKRFIQLSALGEPEDAEFIASKHRFDEHLQASQIDSVVIRPSVVMSTRGSYGGTSLLRSLAALPGVLLIPGQGRQVVQPILLEDLVAIFVAAIEQNKASGQTVYAVGPDVVTIMQLLTALRSWLKLSPTWIISVPMKLVSPCIRFVSKFFSGPLNETILVMLQRGNVAQSDSHQALTESTGVQPKSVLLALQSTPSFVQDRWHAQLYWLHPILWISIGLVWILSAISGAYAEPTDFRPVLDNLGIAINWQQMLVFLLSIFDCVLGVMLLLQKRVKLVLWTMLVSVIGYTVCVGLASPIHWFLPMGGLAKNLALIPALAMLLVMENSR